MPDPERYPLNLYLVNNVENIGVFLLKSVTSRQLPLRCFKGEMSKSFYKETTIEST